jgi:hypothetical protein
MKKFTEIGNKNMTTESSNNKIDFIKNVIEESISIENGEIKGKDVLLKTIQSILSLNESKIIINVLETIKANSYKYLNLEWINEAIENQKEIIKNFSVKKEEVEIVEIVNEAKERNENIDEKNKVISLYKKGKSQSEIATLTGINIDKVIKYTDHLGHYVGNNKYEDDRLGDDASSKQYYDKTIESKKDDEEPITEKISGKVNMTEDYFQTEMSELSKLMESIKLNEEHHLDTKEEKIKFIIDNIDKKKDVITKALSKLPSYVKDADIKETLNNMTDKEVNDLYLEIEK